MAQNKTVLQQIGASTAEFSRKLLSEVLQAHEGNLVASPLSAQLVLVLAQLGARGRTAEQMKVGLALPEDVETVKTGFHELMKSLTRKPDYESCRYKPVVVEIANRMYVKTGFGIEADFVADVEKTFNSTVESVEFEDPAVRTQINKWVEEATHDKIKDLIPDGVFNQLTRLVLVNTVYFKGQWDKAFSPCSTRPLPFYTDSTKNVLVPFMYQECYYLYAHIKSLNAEIVQMLYVGHETSLVIVLPKSRTGLAALEAKMKDQNLPDLLKNTSRRLIELFLPKFKIEFFINLNPQLQKMGMSDVFGDSADFSGISPPVPFDPLSVLRVSHVMQKTFIEIDEKGTEAASASFGVLCGGGPPAPPPKSIKVCVDHPFLLFLISEKTRECEPVVLFAGRVTNIPPA